MMTTKNAGSIQVSYSAESILLVADAQLRYELSHIERQSDQVRLLTQKLREIGIMIVTLPTLLGSDSSQFFYVKGFWGFTTNEHSLWQTMIQLGEYALRRAPDEEVARAAEELAYMQQGASKDLGYVVTHNNPYRVEQCDTLDKACALRDQLFDENNTQHGTAKSALIVAKIHSVTECIR